MTDLALELSADGADLILEAEDLVLDEGLESAVLVSLFSDARASAEQELPGGAGSGLRGWWAEDEGEGFGSLLWLTSRSKTTDETVNLVREYAQQGLEWLVAEGIAAAVEVTALRTDQGTIILSARLTRGTSRRWETIWAALQDATFQVGTVQLHLLAA